MTSQQAAQQRSQGVSAATFGVLAGLLAMAPFSIDFVLPALPAAMQDFAAGPSALRMVSASTFIGSGLGQIFGGPLGDRLGRRLPAVLGALGFGFSALGCALAPSFLVLLSFSIALGFAGALGVVSARAAVRDVAIDDSAAHLLSRVLAVTGLVPVFAPLVGGQLFHYAGWRSIYFTLSMLGFLFAGVARFVFVETLHVDDRHDGTHADQARTFLQLLRDRRFLAYSLAQTGAYVAFIGYVSAAPFIFQKGHGWSAQQFSLLYACNALAMASMTRWNARQVLRRGAHSMLVSGVSLSALAGMVMVLGGIDNSAAVTALGCILLTSACGLTMGNAISQALSSQTSAAGMAAGIVGVMSFGVGGAISIGVGLAGGASATTSGFIMLLGAGVAWLALQLLRNAQAGMGLPA